MKLLLASISALTIFSATAQVNVAAEEGVTPQSVQKTYYVCKKGGKVLNFGITYFSWDTAVERRNCEWQGGMLFTSTTGYPW
ncbi:hypothetical protein [Pseudoalteromonas luteoviolacea]|uniref:Chitin-binding type-2 domain-containing protein n=1 Tax=Pseudoalteromonas luteoviolacea H33 TaxID=1365251 RepID=A0A167EK41_9GAMM|nr:hypothetical protein [Pseudoalteromonas luteoviolacea]KZN50875.1 hypothetical protein N476_14635 [Pseudoalteromonas luteoviolacea H33]KZN74949.1 hypothetical protein N477_20275 [Pseudoalteromonas luteoviolacea H33-S]